MHTILQNESSECGLACLTMIANHYGNNTSLQELRRQFPVSLKGVTLDRIIHDAGALYLTARALRLEIDELNALRLPAILHWNLGHFVVLESVDSSRFGSHKLVVHDPAIGRRSYTIAEFSEKFTGVALELIPAPTFIVRAKAKRVTIAELAGKISGLRRALIKIIFLALALEIFAIVSPLFNQFIIDEVIVSGDVELLKVMAIGFGIFLVTQSALSLARSWVLMLWGSDIGLQWGARVFYHLVRLPATYFERRHLGDIVSRFGSLSSIQKTLTSVFVESMLDGLMAILAFGMMVAYSVKLTAVVVIALLVYVIVRSVTYYALREASAGLIMNNAKENSFFLETMRAIVPVKLFGRENVRTSRWLNLKQEVQNGDIRTQKLAILYKTAHSFITGIQGLLVLYLGAGLIIEQHLSVGMLMAFNSYAATFVGRISNLIDLYINARMLGMHADRLADIVKEPLDIETDVTEQDLSTIDSRITLRNVSFRYADGEPWIFTNLNLDIAEGESIALVGPSGCGKSTLCKIIIGLIKPTHGEILLGGKSINKIGMSAYRSLIGTVMQEDLLLAGSIRDNISFFDPNAVESEIIRCAILASIHEDILLMPMRYETLVGDMGSSLSGGQKQRVLIARALYKRPRILAFDEATSHLDIQRESEVVATLSKLEMTRIMVAHRHETIRSAQRVISLFNGKLTEARLDPSTGKIVAAQPEASVK